MTKKLPWIFPGMRRPNFNLHRLTFRIPTKVPNSVLYVIIYAIIFYIFAGGAYNIVNRDTLISIGSSGSQPVFIHSSVQAQFLIEGLVAGFVFALASLSLYLLDYATKFAFDVNTAQKIEALAALLLTIWYAVILLMYNAKG